MEESTQAEDGHVTRYGPSVISLCHFRLRAWRLRMLITAHGSCGNAWGMLAVVASPLCSSRLLPSVWACLQW